MINELNDSFYTGLNNPYFSYLMYLILGLIYFRDQYSIDNYQY